MRITTNKLTITSSRSDLRPEPTRTRTLFLHATSAAEGELRARQVAKLPGWSFAAIERVCTKMLAETAEWQRAAKGNAEKLVLYARNERAIRYVLNAARRLA
jgi:hypothetical protein